MDRLQLLADPIAVQSCTLATQDLPDVGEVLAAEEHHLEDGERFGVPDDNRPIAKGSGRLLSSGIASAPLEELDGQLRPRIRLLRRKAGGQSTAIDFGSRAAGADDHFTALPVRERGHSILVESICLGVGGNLRPNTLGVRGPSPCR